MKHNRLPIIFLGIFCVTMLAVYGSAKHLLGDEAIPFFKGIIKHPKMVGAFAPCSRTVAQEVIKYIDTLHGEVAIVEVGGGTGQFTAELEKKLNTMLHTGRITSYIVDVIEINPEFCQVLKSKFKDNPRIQIYCTDIVDWQPHYQYEAIISSIPFTNIPKKLVKNILRAYEQMIKQGHTLSYIELMFFPKFIETITWGDTKRELQEKSQLIADFRNTYLLETVKIWRNIPPLYVHHLRIKK